MCYDKVYTMRSAPTTFFDGRIHFISNTDILNICMHKFNAKMTIDKITAIQTKNFPACV